MNYKILGKTSLRVSELGFGASTLGGLFNDVDEKEAIKTVHEAFDQGINYFDTSPAYGRPDSPYGAVTSETILGKALRDLNRSEFILSTKAGKFASLPPELDFHYDKIVQSVESSLKRLHTDYLDILILHDIEYDKGRYLDTALSEGLEAAMDLKKEGKIKSFGISCYAIPVLERVIRDHNLDLVLVHNHNTLTDDLINQLIPGIQAKAMGLICASPFASGLLTSQGPPDWFPITEEELDLIQKAIDWCSEKNISIEQLAFKHAISHPDITTTLFSCNTRKMLRKNIEWAKEPSDLSLIRDLRNLLKPLRNRDFDFGGYNH